MKYPPMITCKVCNINMTERTLSAFGGLLVVILVSFALTVQPAQAKKAANDSIKSFPSLKAIYYLYDRGHNTLSLIYSAKSLSHGLAFWGFTDFSSLQDKDASRSDTDSFFTEARLSKMFSGGWGVQGEYNDASAQGNDLVRLGAVYQFPLTNHFLMLRVFPLESDGEGGQVSLVWRTKLGMDSLIFEGFIDYNIKENQKNRIVAEPQLGFRFS
ncbi:MAG: hypothetical protein ACJAXW_001949 [Candidatus Azotimanducaceae bacterium]|jgi:hypothetical protein